MQLLRKIVCAGYVFCGKQYRSIDLYDGACNGADPYEGQPCSLMKQQRYETTTAETGHLL